MGDNLSGLTLRGERLTRVHCKISPEVGLKTVDHTISWGRGWGELQEEHV